MRARSLTLAVVLALAACAPSSPEPATPTPAPAPAEPAGGPPADDMLGGCILTTPSGEVPADLYQQTEIVATDEYPPFTKKLTVYGITLVGDDEISDAFMGKVARTIREIFPREGDVDLETQAELIANLYRYRTTIPLIYGSFEGVPEEMEADWNATASRNTVCDIIMEAVPGQVMEVVEHILHFVSDVGLHYTFPDTWGISADSALAAGMNAAIEGGYYDIEQYGDIEDGAVHQRVLLQELAYWVISTAWNLQEPYGPVGEAEWTIVTEAQLQASLPELYGVFQRTVATVMTAPSLETLQDIGPTRAEERARRQ